MAPYNRKSRNLLHYSEIYHNPYHITCSVKTWVEEMGQIELSAVVSAFNEENFEFALINSDDGFRHEKGNCEIIVIDDGNRNNIRLKALQYAGKNSRVKMASCFSNNSKMNTRPKFGEIFKMFFDLLGITYRVRVCRLYGKPVMNQSRYRRRFFYR